VFLSRWCSVVLPLSVDRGRNSLSLAAVSCRVARVDSVFRTVYGGFLMYVFYYLGRCFDVDPSVVLIGSLKHYY
jgi:hypothetical protein